jgi:hypothetical protein
MVESNMIPREIFNEICCDHPATKGVIEDEVNDVPFRSAQGTIFTGRVQKRAIDHDTIRTRCMLSDSAVK